MPHTMTPAERIWQVVHAIPKGKVCTYGQVAQLAGLPGHARQVGYTLARLPEGSNLPWHRVINSKGNISFPAGSALFETQAALLLAEGITVKDGRVTLKQWQWQP